MIDEGMNSLRDMAVAAAEGRPIMDQAPQTEPPQAYEQHQNTEPNGVAVEVTPRQGNPLFAQAKIYDVTMVGDTPVYAKPAPAPVPQNIPTQPNMGIDPGAEMLMRASNQQPAPAPTNFGLDESALESPTIPGIPAASDNESLYNSLLFNLDGSFSSGQLKLMSEHLISVPVNEYENLTRDLFSGVEAEFKTLITRVHLSVSEAQKASYDRIVATLDRINEDYLKNHPNMANIVIDKSQDVNDLGLTKEEHAKLEKAKKVRLVLLEDVDLATIEFEHPPENHISDYIKSIEGTLAKYSVPLPMLGDFVSFKGAQIIQMVNIIRYDDSKLDENVSTKASLIYDKLISGSILKRYNETGESKMSYNEFINTFPYDDIDMAIFGILCASSLEESQTSVTCQHCDHTWMHSYNLKNLIKLDNVPESIKERIDSILANKSNDVILRDMYSERRKVRRYRSPFSNNVYDISYPTVARALDILKRINEDDSVMAYYALIALYMQQINIYNGKTGKYVAVSAEKPDLILETLKTLTKEDIDLLSNKVREDFYYRPEFMMEVECPTCGRVSKITLNIDSLIFLIAQDSMAEIE